MNKTNQKDRETNSINSQHTSTNSWELLLHRQIPCTVYFEPTISASPIYSFFSAFISLALRFFLRNYISCAWIMYDIHWVPYTHKHLCDAFFFFALSSWLFFFGPKFSLHFCYWATIFIWISLSCCCYFFFSFSFPLSLIR